MICGKCKLEIHEKDYCSVSDFHNNKRVKEVFLHIKCYVDHEEKKSNMKEAMGMMRGLKGVLKNMGVLPKEEYLIK